MLTGHRWRYSFDLRQYYCAPLPLDGVESHQWCVGCGVTITAMELYESGYPKPQHYSDGYVEGVYLDLLALGKGRDAVEAGTYASWLLRKTPPAGHHLPSQTQGRKEDNNSHQAEEGKDDRHPTQRT